MEIENQPNRSKRRVSFVPIEVNEPQDEVYEPSVIELEKEELRQRREQQKGSKSNHLPLPSKNAERSSRIAEMYANIIRMSNENKINQKNTWNLDLINHMEDVILEGSDDVETNFQKASTTLDASIKIYGYRVDDTLNTGYRILDSLNRGEQAKTQVEAPKQSKKLGVVNTIESNLRSIQMDSSEMTYDADPLFHLMSRRFDEGGVKGLLLSNLGVSNGWNVVFDSNEVVEVEEVPKKEELSDMNTFVDVGHLFQIETLEEQLQKPVCSALNPLFDEIRRYADDCKDLDESYQEEEEERNRSVLEDQYVELDEEVVPIPVRSGGVAQGESGGVAQGESGNTSQGKNGNTSQDPFLEEFDNYDFPEMEVETDQPAQSTSDGKRNNPSLQRTNEIERLIVNSKPTEYHYFQPSLLTKSWAGPSYWQIGRVGKTKKAKKETSKAKKGPVITFSEEQTINPTERFVAVKRKSDIVMSDAQFTAQRNRTLPEDHHYKFDNLIKLNCRRDITLNRVVNFTINTSQRVDLDEWELDPSNVDIGGCVLENPMDILDTSPAEIDTPPGDVSVDHGAMDDFGMDEPSHVGFISDVNESTSHSLLQADRVVERISIAYANQATRVDIQELKERMWEQLESQLSQKEMILFSEIVREVKRRKKEDIAIQFFFICILHISFVGLVLVLNPL